ncbi:hypothetical protein HPP92_018780 [Vanilla planifolia]|uniref:Uncharacterized protein n=1 Tax=Vanilla planifolia TaxID=51239 RepID=A0A835UNP4_VANPL|nr:hypothetical protein HPP92_018780 [Vanilla planifolia]
MKQGGLQVDQSIVEVATNDLTNKPEAGRYMFFLPGNKNLQGRILGGQIKFPCLDVPDFDNFLPIEYRNSNEPAGRHAS